MIDENRFEWEVYYNGELLGRTNTEGRHQLIKDKVKGPIDIMSPIEYKLVLKHPGVKIWDLTCSECAMTEPMQPCEACRNREAQGL